MFAEIFTRHTTLQLDPMPRALKAVADLQKMCQVIVVTARTGEILEAAREWLDQYEETRGLEVLGVSERYVSKGDRCAAERVELLVDDDQGHLSSATDFGIETVLLKVDAPTAYAPAGVATCRSWEEVTRKAKRWLAEDGREILAPVAGAGIATKPC